MNNALPTQFPHQAAAEGATNSDILMGNVPAWPEFSQQSKGQPPFSGHHVKTPNSVGQHETLLSQYKKCSEINNEQLRNARNLEELVGIKVHAIDNRLGTGASAPGQGRSGNQSYDFKFDPIHFRQKVPCMGDRSFLVNQAILSSSTQTKRLASFGNNHKPGSMPSRGNTASTGFATGQIPMNLLSAEGSSVNNQPFSIGDPKVATSGQLNPVERLASRETAEHGAVLSDQAKHDELENATVQDIAAGAQDGKTEADSQLTQQDISQVDPIHALKSIFKKKDRKRRGPLDLNPVINKYKKLGHIRSQHIKSLQESHFASQQIPQPSRFRQHPFLASGKVYKEDNFGNTMPAAFGGGPEFSQADSKSENNFNMTALESAKADTGEGGGDFIQNEQLRELGVKDRLENLRKLFAEEDINETVKNIQNDWELEEQKIISQKQSQLYSNIRASDRPTGSSASQETANQNDLRHYLTNKIKQYHDRSDPVTMQENLKEVDEQRQVTAEGESRKGQKITFKASTLTHIAEMKKFGQEQIESSLIERLFRQQNDYHFERYTHTKQVQFKKQATSIRRRTKNKAGLKSQDDVSSRATPSQASGYPEKDNSRTRFKPQKPKNIMQAQLEKIGKIDRMADKMQKQMQDEIRNAEIYDIIKDTQQEMRNSLNEQQDILGSMQSKMTGVGPQFDNFEVGYPRQIMPEEQFEPAPQIGFEKNLETQRIQVQQSSQIEKIDLASTRQQQSLTTENPAFLAGKPEPPSTHGRSKKVSSNGDTVRHEDDKLKQHSQIEEGVTVPEDAQASQLETAKIEETQPAPLTETIPLKSQQPQPSPRQLEQTIPEQSAQAEPKTITSKVNLGNMGNVDVRGPAVNEIKVSQMVKQYNELQQQRMGVESPSFEIPYASDTELFQPFNRNQMRGSLSPESRGGGFKDQRKRRVQNPNLDQTYQTVQEFMNYDRETRNKIKKAYKRSQPLKEIEEEPFEVTHGKPFSYFCPKRFNRYPRFTIFFKREKGQVNNQYVMENTVSLSPQFLSYLMDKGSIMKNPIIQQQTKALQQQSQEEIKTADSALDIKQPIKSNFQKLQSTLPLEGGPEDAVFSWNQKNESIQNYDPFEKVVLVKGIDNSILTSFRTLKRENNTVSDTFKIVHQKFLPQKNKSLYFKSIIKNQADKLSLYPLTDNEDALEFAQAELLAESLLNQGDHSNVYREDGGEPKDLSQKQLKVEQQRNSFGGDNLNILSQAATSSAADHVVKIAEIGKMEATNPTQFMNSTQSNNVNSLLAHVPQHKNSLPSSMIGAAKHSSPGVDGTGPLSTAPIKEGRPSQAPQAQPLPWSNLSNKNQSKSQVKSVMQSTVPPYSQQQHYANEAGSASRPSAHQQMQFSYANGDNSQSSLANNKMRPNLFGKGTDYDRAPGGDQNLVPILPPSIPHDSPMLKDIKGPLPKLDSARMAAANKNQFKHQIEVMVLSKVDPLDSAFQQNMMKQNLTSSYSQGPAQSATIKNQTGMLPSGFGGGPVYHQGMTLTQNKRNPFKNGPGGRTQSNTIGKTSKADINRSRALADISQKKQSSGQYNQVTEGKQEPSSFAKDPEQEIHVTRSKVEGAKDTFKSKSSHQAGSQPSYSGREKAPGDKSDTEVDGKYGKDFKIPELPPLLQAHLFGDEQSGVEAIKSMPSEKTPFISSGSNNQYKIKKFIDDIYQKEMRYRYHKQYVREDFLLTKSPIFNLSKFHHLQPQCDILPNNKRSKTLRNRPHGFRTEHDDGPGLHNKDSQSLTNVLGFQAGGPNVIVPQHPQMLLEKQMLQSQLQQLSNQNMISSQEFEAGKLQNNQIRVKCMGTGGVYNSNQIYFNGDVKIPPAEPISNDPSFPN